ncbi:MAG TPA: amine oxidase [Cytophagales bacterium]|jgi:protoporphyrinogen oxidase|nr:amine oxidase [Cytophagales bacterium]
MQEDKKILIIGAGVAGLIAAYELEQSGLSPVIFEASDRVGGRVNTDHDRGFVTDRGFQVLLTDYPEAKHYLDYRSLDLMRFDPGAIIYGENEIHSIEDPLRNPSTIFSMLFSGVGTFKDKFLVYRLTRKLKRKSIENIFKDPSQKTMDYLVEFGFSDKIISSFFKPFFAGIFLEKELATSSRMFEFVFKMFSTGYAAIPKGGIHKIPMYLHKKLERTEIKFNTKISKLGFNYIVTDQGKQYDYDALIIATQPDELLPGMKEQFGGYQYTHNLYFSSSTFPFTKPKIALIEKKGALINNFCDLSALHSSFAPADQHLISVTVVDDQGLKEEALIDGVKQELSAIIGVGLSDLKFIRQYNINNALPIVDDIKMDMQPSASKIQDQIYLAGDYLLNGSLNAAIVSGRNAASAVINQLNAANYLNN